MDHQARVDNREDRAQDAAPTRDSAGEPPQGREFASEESGVRVRRQHKRCHGAGKRTDQREDLLTSNTHAVSQASPLAIQLCCSGGLLVQV